MTLTTSTYKQDEYAFIDGKGDFTHIFRADKAAKEADEEFTKIITTMLPDFLGLSVDDIWNDFRVMAEKALRDGSVAQIPDEIKGDK